MKLKCIVTAMSVLGLISFPVFADTKTTSKPITQKTIQRDTKAVKEHTLTSRQHHAHHAVEAEEADTGYREVAAPEAASEMVTDEACNATSFDLIMDGMTQNFGRALANPCATGFLNRIRFSGGMNVDLGKWGPKTIGYMGENYKRISMNDAYLNVTADVNEWTEAFVSLSYNTATTLNPRQAFLGRHVAEYSAAYSNNVRNGEKHNVQLQQAYFTIANFEATPIFLQAGQQFQDFNRYQLFPITRSMTQVMSETLAPSVKLGFIVPSGVHGSIFAFNNPIAKEHHNHSNEKINYGASLGVDVPNDCFGWAVGASYLYNMIGVNDVAYNVGQYHAGVLDADEFVDVFHGQGYHRHVGGMAVYGDVNSGPFYLHARYVTAVKRFSVHDLPKFGSSSSLHGAKPWAIDAQIGLNFTNVILSDCHRNQNLYVGYQTSHQASALNLPKTRWQVGYEIEALKNTNVGFEWDRDHAYAKSHGGKSRHHNNLATIRLAVQYS